MKEKTGIKQRLRDLKAESAESAPVFPRIMMYSNREAIISGCSGIAEYSESVIQLKCKDIILALNGAGLVIDSFVSDEVRITGIIAAMEFSN